MKKNKFSVSGMTSTACVGTIEKSVGRLTGVKNVDVNLLTGSMSVTYDEKITTEKQIIDAVARVGYTASEFDYDDLNGKSKAKRYVERKCDPVKMTLAKLISSGVLLLMILYLSLGFKFGLPLPSFFTQDYGLVNLAMTEFMLTIPIILMNQFYFTDGFKALARRSPNMNTLIAMGASASIAYSICLIYAIINNVGGAHQSIAGSYCGELYFESCALILTFLTLGKYIESYSKGKAKEVVTKFVNLAPKTAVVFREGEELEIPAGQVTVGDTVIVKSGQAIPADGVVIEGSAAIDESAITGESIPVDKSVGDDVIAATVNKTGYIKFRVTRVGQDTTIANIIKIVEDAVTTKTPMSKLADKVSGIFVPIVAASAFISFIVWSIIGYGFGFAISTAVAVLVIACPCALSLATPTSIMVGMGLGTQNGIMIKSAEPLQAAKKIDIVALDKTGIITEGDPRVTDIFPIAPLTEIQLAAIAAAMENMSEHPYARAIVDFAHEQGIKILNADNFNALSGLGIEASMFGRKLYAGSLNFMQQNGIKLFGYDIKGAALAEKGKTPLYFSDDKKLLGMIAVEDKIKESSYVAIEEFEKMGIEVIILTGDNKRTTKAIAKQLGINNAVSEILPDEKEHEIKNLQSNGKKVAMIGDGINDAPALAAADIGIAIGAGTDIAVESADIILMKSDLTDAVAAVQLCHAVFKNIKQNLFLAFIFNVLMMPIAAGVLYTTLHKTMNPSFTAVVMSISSICVILNALRLKRYRSKYFRSAVAVEDEAEQFKIKVANTDPGFNTVAVAAEAQSHENYDSRNGTVPKIPVRDDGNHEHDDDGLDVKVVDPRDMAISNIEPALELMPDYTTQIPIITQEMLKGNYDFSKMKYTIKTPQPEQTTQEENTVKNKKLVPITQESAETAQSSSKENEDSADIETPEHDYEQDADNLDAPYDEYEPDADNEEEPDYSDDGNRDYEDNELKYDNDYDEPDDAQIDINEYESDEHDYDDTDVYNEDTFDTVEMPIEAFEQHSVQADENDVVDSDSQYGDYTYDDSEDDDSYNAEGDDEVTNNYSKIVLLGGLKDENTAARTEQALNSLQGVNAIVDFDSGNARVFMDRDYTNETIVSIIEGEGLTVLSIDNM